MAWIWSSKCLALLCISTQSIHIKWVSGGGINSPRHPKSRWLMTTQKGSVRWTKVMLFQGVNSSGALHVTELLHLRWHNYSDAMLWRCIRSSGAEGLVAKTLLSGSSRPSDELVHPVLKASSWCVSILIQTKRWIDRQCPHLDSRFSRCYWLRCFSFADHLAHLETRPSDHPMVSTSFCLLRNVPSVPTLAPMVPSVHLMVPLSSFPLRLQLLIAST
jgi:hypothetical protein